MRCSELNIKSGPPALTPMAATITSSNAEIMNLLLFFCMTHFPPFDPFVFHSTSHERQETVGVDGALLRRQQSFVLVVQEFRVNFDIFEQTRISELADCVSALECDLALAEPDSCLKSRYRRALVEKQHRIFADRILGPTVWRNAQVDLSVAHLARLC